MGLPPFSRCRHRRCGNVSPAWTGAGNLPRRYEGRVRAAGAAEDASIVGKPGLPASNERPFTKHHADQTLSATRAVAIRTPTGDAALPPSPPRILPE